MPEKLWQQGKISKWLLTDLYNLWGRRQFKNEDAYWIYAVNGKHWFREGGLRLCRTPTEIMAYYTDKVGNTSDAYWSHMNVRNTLCMAAYKGILKRLGPGKYKFNVRWNPEKYNCKGEKK